MRFEKEIANVGEQIGKPSPFLFAEVECLRVILKCLLVHLHLAVKITQVVQGPDYFRRIAEFNKNLVRFSMYLTD